MKRLVKNNLILTLRERGKIVMRREGHNVWLDVGRTLLCNLIAYNDFSPLTAAEDNRPRYMGFGIGGSRQTLLSAQLPPLSTHYPGTNLQSDVNQHLTRLERPVRFSSPGAPTLPSGTYPTLTYDPADVFLRQADAPPVSPTTTSRKFTCTIAEADVSYGLFGSVGLSEIGLFSNAAGINDYAASPVAYDTFDSIPKSSLFTLQVEWSIRF